MNVICDKKKLMKTTNHMLLNFNFKNQIVDIALKVFGITSLRLYYLNHKFIYDIIYKGVPLVVMVINHGKLSTDLFLNGKNMIFTE